MKLDFNLAIGNIKDNWLIFSFISLYCLKYDLHHFIKCCVCWLPVSLWPVHPSTDHDIISPWLRLPGLAWSHNSTFTVFARVEGWEEPGARCWVCDVILTWCRITTFAKTNLIGVYQWEVCLSKSKYRFDLKLYLLTLNPAKMAPALLQWMKKIERL